MKKLNLILVAILCLTGLKAQQTPHTAILYEMNYLLYLPQGYEQSDEKWPMVVALHGAGEVGTNIDKIKVHGIPMLIEQGKQFPFIALSPQAPEHGWKPDMVKKLVEKIRDEYKVDEERIYLTGLSMGGFGTWETAILDPSLFAAIIPICGGGNPENVWKLRNMPVWCFHGDADNIVPLNRSEVMVNALQPINPKVKFTVYPGEGHESWIRTYENDEIYDWLLSHKRFRYTEIDLPEESLYPYAGTYVNDDYEFFFVAGKDGLQCVREEQLDFTLIPLGNDCFYINPDNQEIFIFVKDQTGQITDLMIENRWGRFEFSRR